MGMILTTGDVMMCPHGGTVTIVSANTKALADGAPIVRPNDVFTIAGCPISTPAGPHPCVLVQWQMPSAAASADGNPALTTDSIGLCQAADQAAQGTVLIQKTQSKASAR